MKVVILHTDFRLYWPARLRALLKELAILNISLQILEIAGAGSPYAFANKFNQRELPINILFPSERMEDLRSKDIERKVIEKLDFLCPDVVIAGAVAFPSGALAVRWARKNHKRVIIFDDAQKDDVHRNSIVNFIKRSVYHGVDAMFYPSQAWEHTGKFWDFKSSQLFYGLDVVDNSFWQKPIKNDNSLPKDFFLCIGRQVPKKNVLFILEAYRAYLQKVQRPYKLLIIGDGIEHSKIVQYISQYNLNDYVLLRSFVQQEILVGIYRQACALIIGSKRGETWGLVINEAMASGLPIIASDKCGATSTLVKDELNGYVFSASSLTQLEEKMVKFHLLSTEKRKLMSKSSLEIIKDWNLDTFARSLCKAILFVIQQPERHLSVLERCIINLWSGRYRPM